MDTFFSRSLKIPAHIRDTFRRNSRGIHLSNVSDSQHWKESDNWKIIFFDWVSRKIWKWKFIFFGIFASRGGELLIGEGRADGIANFALKITKIKSRVVPQNNKIGLNDPAQDDLLRSLWAITIRSWQRFCRTCCSWRVARVNHSRSLGQWLCNQVIK